MIKNTVVTSYQSSEFTSLKQGHNSAGCNKILKIKKGDCAMVSAFTENLDSKTTRLFLYSMC